MLCRALLLGRSLRIRPSLHSKARHVSSMAQSEWKGLAMKEKGEPLDVLELRELPAADPRPGQVLVKMMAAPVNPSDVNTVQGKYPLQPKYDSVPGHEGVGQVVGTGADSGTLKEGDLVVPLTSGLGTWRTYGVYAANDWHKVPADVRVEDAATACINPATALSMLENFETLQPGDVVVQNGANSAVGKHVIQLCKHMQVRTVNVVRDRPDMASLEASLKALGADMVVTPDTVREQVKAAGMPAPKLALNCVGGEIATTMSKMLTRGGTIVTYGGMSMQPVSIPTPVLIFKDIKVRGFWISGGETSVDPQLLLLPQRKKKAAIIDRVVSLMQQGVMGAEATCMPLDEWKTVMSSVAAGSKDKYLFTM